jgi:hypothetical protein
MTAAGNEYLQTNKTSAKGGNRTLRMTNKPTKPSYNPNRTETRPLLQHQATKVLFADLENSLTLLRQPPYYYRSCKPQKLGQHRN